MSPQTLTEKLLLQRAATPIVPGSQYFRIPVDLVLGHDATIALLIERFKQAGYQIWDPKRCFFAADHFAPPSTPERADILNRYLEFVRENAIPHDQLFRGISHQLLVEDVRCRPGMVICGADSHTVMAGALGCFATGMGSTDILALLLTGTVILSVPESIHVELVGHLPAWLFGKDIILDIIRRIGEGGALGCAIEYHDHTDQGIRMDSRFAIANMCVEAGATNGVFLPDEVMRRYLTERDAKSRRATEGTLYGDLDWEYLKPDPTARYKQALRISVQDIPPLVALPHNLGRIVPIDEVQPMAVQQVFIGSCVGGRIEDLAIAAALLRGKRVAPGLRLVVTPASQSVYCQCVQNGIFEILAEAGALITNSSCGACGGIDKGLIGASEVCVSTSNRNFRGRMGSPEGLIYLTSPISAAAAALVGHLVDPRPFLEAVGIQKYLPELWPFGQNGVDEC